MRFIVLTFDDDGSHKNPRATLIVADSKSDADRLVKAGIESGELGQRSVLGGAVPNGWLRDVAVVALGDSLVQETIH